MELQEVGQAAGVSADEEVFGEPEEESSPFYPEVSEARCLAPLEPLHNTSEARCLAPPEVTETKQDRKTRQSSMSAEERGILAELEGLADSPKSEANNLRKKTLVAQMKPLKSVRLANMRINAALQKLGLVENLAVSQYQFTQDQKNSMIEVLSNAVIAIQSKFDGVKSTENKFSLC